MDLLEVSIYVVLPLIFLIIIIILWKKYGKDQKLEIKETKQLPSDLNVLQVSYLYNNKECEDFIPFIIELANKGYIKIKKENKKYKIIKIKEPTNNIELYFINELFNNKKEIDLKENKDKMIKLIKEINKKIISKYEVDKIYEEKSLSKKSLTKFMIFMIYMIVLIKLLFDLNNLKLFLISMIIPIIGMKILFKTITNKNIKVKIIGLIISVLLILLPIIFIETKINTFNYSILYLISLILIDIMIIFNILMPKMKTSIMRLKNKIKGFELFITNKEKIISLINENNDYYYQIYPYLLLFNINIKKLNITNPTWYEEK